MVDKESIIPKIKRSISDYISNESGQISKHKMIALGAFLATFSFLNMMPEVEAAHTNSFSASWSTGTLSADHAHHVSSVL